MTVRPGQGPVVLAEDVCGRHAEGSDVVGVERVEKVAAGLRHEQFEEQVSGLLVGLRHEHRNQLADQADGAVWAGRDRGPGQCRVPAFSSTIAVPRAGTTAL
jgi:hypothetical protein